GKEGYRGDRELSVKELLTQIRQLNVQPDPSGDYIKKRISAYMVEVHKKFSIPAACLVFILIGAPLGILAHRGGIGLAGGISLLFFVIYWMFLSNGETLADRGKLSPAIAMWLPNVILALVGFWFLWLARRRTTFPGIAVLVNLGNRIFHSKAIRDNSKG
ncbi:MAG: LptF/LptG family permease, partial [Calditrichota bacterium]